MTDQQAAWDRLTTAVGLPRSNVTTRRSFDPLSRWQRIRGMRYWAQSVGAVALLLKVVGLAAGVFEVRHEIIERENRPFSVADTTARNSRISDLPVGAAASIWYAPRDSAPKTVVLYNGSKVTLTPGSSFSFARNQGRVIRADEARLDGEATIEIVPNAPVMKVTMAAGLAGITPGRYRLRGTAKQLEVDVSAGLAVVRMTGLFLSQRAVTAVNGQQVRGNAGHLPVRSPLLAPTHP